MKTLENSEAFTFLFFLFLEVFNIFFPSIRVSISYIESEINGELQVSEFPRTDGWSDSFKYNQR